MSSIWSNAITPTMPWYKVIEIVVARVPPISHTICHNTVFKCFCVHYSLPIQLNFIEKNVYLLLLNE